jgi:hypothetical protein
MQKYRADARAGKWQSRGLDPLAATSGSSDPGRMLPVDLVLAARNAGENGLGSAPFELGSGRFGVPFARMQWAYFSACVSADPELLGLEEDPHAASAMAHTAIGARRRPVGVRRSAV